MQVPRHDLESVLSALTPREREIVGLVAAGRPNKVIAIDLGISLRTAEAHRARIFAKLDARNAMQLACRLCAHGRSGSSPILNAVESDAAGDDVADGAGATATAAVTATATAAATAATAAAAAAAPAVQAAVPVPAPAAIPVQSAAMARHVLHEPPAEYGACPAESGAQNHDP
ncbi:response regulator transcription factor [Achromobacter kerstersii]|uniref:response regulator transcription factor n=1 Tax=Achromobacter kerstersii TaxID=1353890 RepID=UPI0009EB1976|nr:helix-turn-helix transcriptional regulator [Achromobacter kerstersii]